MYNVINHNLSFIYLKKPKPLFELSLAEVFFFSKTMKTLTFVVFNILFVGVISAAIQKNVLMYF